MKRRLRVDAEGLPSIPGMMLVTVEALKELGGSATIQELDEKVIELEGVTEAEQRFTAPGHPNRLRVNYYLAWARTYLKNGEAVVNSARGVWALTESGSAISKLDETQAIYEQFRKAVRDRARAKRESAKAEKPDGPQSIDDETDEADDWKSQLLNVVGAMPPDKFERLSQRRLGEAGFTKVEVWGEPGDGGIDGVGVLRVNLVTLPARSE